MWELCFGCFFSLQPPFLKTWFLYVSLTLVGTRHSRLHLPGLPMPMLLHALQDIPPGAVTEILRSEWLAISSPNWASCSWTLCYFNRLQSLFFLPDYLSPFTSCIIAISPFYQHTPAYNMQIPMIIPSGWITTTSLRPHWKSWFIVGESSQNGRKIQVSEIL